MKSIKLQNINGNFQEYEISEEQFSNLSIDKMLKYIIHNNKNVNEFNEYFYNDLYRIRENVPRSIIVTRRKSRVKRK
jgi:hypothetical protein